MNFNKSFNMFVILILFLAGMANAFVLSGTIKNDQNVRLTGTTVELLQSGTVVLLTTAVSEGKYTLNVTTPGTYILRFTRDGYPQTIMVVELNSDSVRDIVMWETKLASIYGQVAYSDGMPAKELFSERVRLQQNGLYVVGLEGKISGPSGSYAVTSVAPGIYTVVLSSDILDYEKKTITLIEGKAQQINVIVSKKSTPTNTTAPVNPTPETFTLVAPKTSINGNEIKAVLFSSTGIVQGAVMLVKGPGTETTLNPTNAKGEAYFVPKEAGTYTFEYKGATFAVEVAKKAATPEVTETTKPKNQTIIPALPTIPTPKTPQEQAIFGVGATVVLGGALAFVLIVAGIAYYTYSKKKKSEKKTFETPQEIRPHREPAKKMQEKAKKEKPKSKEIPKALKEIMDVDAEETAQPYTRAKKTVKGKK